MDYAGLLAAVASRLDRDDLTSSIPDFVDLAESEICSRLAQDPVRPMVKTYTTSVSAQTNSLPSDFIDAINLTLSDGTDTWQANRLDMSDPFDYYQDRALPYRNEPVASRIFHYAIIGSNLQLSQVPASALTVSLIYFSKPAAVDDSTTNWVLTNHPDVYEMGTLMHAARHLRDDGFEDRMLARFGQAFDLMLGAYPERQNSTELRISDLPRSIRSWNVNTDG